ncbi:centrosome-associated protein cep250-like isoform x1 [Plakobranchus ocellatus]|uniref:Centrosome-associated protein cep250-like isoform x1 n=1 Tax=Plakobranchus ocellatus TaxID=259542 RepID=A0AAV3ZUI9_9GAST|nr:centrosome-associated protein cep250-like isoform x1 [Plakobranchus ocellatus]
MAMNYIGSISILDRGDAPAQAVIDRNARSLAQRMSDETKDELNKVMTRVHNIYSAMDTVDEVYMGPSMEYLNDLAELEEILKDEIKKRQYQQQVTVFIVGYSDVCHQKLRLLQQVNEFFMENNKLIDEEDWFPTTPDMDLEEISNSVEDSLAHAHALTNRLGELNREMVDYVAALAEKKASSKGKKKIEKALQQAKDEQATEDLEILQKEINARDAKILAQRQQLSRLEVELAQSNHLKERTETKFSQSDGERQQRINMLQKELDDEKKEHEETKANLTKLLDNQINAMHESHQQELDELKKEHVTETTALEMKWFVGSEQIKQQQRQK